MNIFLILFHSSLSSCPIDSLRASTWFASSCLYSLCCLLAVTLASSVYCFYVRMLSLRSHLLPIFQHIVKLSNRGWNKLLVETQHSAFKILRRVAIDFGKSGNQCVMQFSLILLLCLIINWHWKLLDGGTILFMAYFREKKSWTAHCKLCIEQPYK